MTISGKPRQTAPSLKWNALSNFGGLAVSLAVGFFLTPAMLAYLGEKRFGMWTLVASLFWYYGLLELGMGSAILRYVPLFRGQGNHHRVSAVINTSMAFYVGLGLVILALSQLLANPLARFFDGGPELASLLRVIGLAAAVMMPSVVLKTAASSYEGFVPVNLIAVGAALLRAALLFGCIFTGRGLMAMGWSLVLVRLALLVGNSVVFKHVCKEVRFSFKNVKRDHFRLLLSFGSVIMIVTLANVLATESPKQVVARTISLDALGLFGIPLILIAYYRIGVISLTKVFSPRYSFLSGRDAGDEIRHLFLRSCRYVAVIAGGVAVFLWVLGPSFIVLWSRKPEMVATVPALTIMVVGTFVLLSNRMAGDLLFGLGKKKQIAVLELSEAVAILGLTIALSRRFGMTGAALGVAIPPIFVRGLLQTYFVCGALKLGFAEYYRKCFLKTWTLVALTTGLGILLDLPALATGWLSLMLVSCLVLGVYGVSVFVWVLKGEERSQVKAEILGLFGRIGWVHTPGD